MRPDDCARTPLRWKVKVTRINRLYDIPMICVYLEKREFWCSLWAATASGMVSLCVHFGFALRRFFSCFMRGIFYVLVRYLKVSRTPLAWKVYIVCTVYL